MSIIYEINNKQIWNPSSSLGLFYYDCSKLVEKLCNVGCGVSLILDDTFEIDQNDFHEFILSFSSYLNQLNNSPLRTMIEGFYYVSLALYYRISGGFPASINLDEDLVTLIKGIEKKLAR